MSVSPTSVFPTEPATSSPPPPTFTPSSDGDNVTSGTMLFGFLVVFVSVFTVIVVAGVICRHYSRSANRRGELILGYDEKTGEYRGVPKLWEVWIEDQKVKDQKQGEWNGLQPLSVDMYSLQPDLAAPSHTPSHHTWLPHRHCRRSSEGRMTNGKHPAEVRAPAKVAQVSFIVAMPSPGRCILAERDVRWSGATFIPRPDWQSGEYAIGTYQVPFREDLKDEGHGRA